MEAAVASNSGVEIVATANGADSAGVLLDAVEQRLIGSLAHYDEAVQLGATDPASLSDRSGRCVSVPDGALVQLADHPASIEEAVRRRLPDDRPPARAGVEPPRPPDPPHQADRESTGT
jgi:hypothetical protein